MQQLGVGGTPLVLIGLTPPPGSPMKVVSFVYGASPIRNSSPPSTKRSPKRNSARND